MIVLKSLPLEALLVSTLLIVSPFFSQANATEIRGGSLTPILVGADSSTVPKGISGADWAGIQAQIAAGTYRADKHAIDGFVSSNPAHGWQIRFAADGTTTLRPRDRQAQVWHLGLKLSAVGFSEPKTLDRPQQITADDFTVSYQWNDSLREWWVNSENDLEQWFELKKRPPGAKNGQPLTLDMTLATDLVVSQHGNALSFVNTAGTSISYDQLKAWDANGRKLPAWMQLTVNTLSLIIDDSDASYPLTIDPSFIQQAYLKASNTEDGGDWFGWSVAISGDTLVVGAPREDSSTTDINGDHSNNSAFRAGATYVFVRSGTSWSQQAYLKASNTGIRDGFGQSVAVSGDTVVVGAYLEDGNATGINGDQSDNSAENAGAAYVFTRNGTVWSQQAYLKASNTGEGDLFGRSVAISGDTVVVGAYREASNATGINGDESDNSADNAGAAYIFTRSGTVWNQQAYLKASNTDGFDNFSLSVAISGDTVVVGAGSERSNATGINGDQSDNSTTQAGAVYVFTRNGMTWSQQAYLKASNTDSGDAFGASVAISGDTLVVGASGEESYATGVNGDQSDNSGIANGAAYIFTRSSTVWSQQAYLKAPDSQRGDRFGGSAAISGDMVVVGAVGEHSNVNGDRDAFFFMNAGAAYVFTHSGTVWSQQAYLKASNTEIFDFFGRSVAVSGDTVVVGAYLEDSNTTGINGDQGDNSADAAGAVYVFTHFTINAGLNDAWVSADAPFQGFFFTVFPDLGLFFLSWFTFDLVPPDQNVIAIFGAPDQRWVTASGAFTGDTVTLSVELTSGGVFNSSDPLATQVPAYGTITIVFLSCGEALLSYDFPSLMLSGQMTLTRVVPDNEALCEALNGM